jgi:hypothetical protein
MRDWNKALTIFGAFLLLVCILTVCHPGLRKAFFHPGNGEEDFVPNQTAPSSEIILWEGQAGEKVRIIVKSYFDDKKIESFNTQALNRSLGFEEKQYYFGVWWLLNESEDAFALDLSRDGLVIRGKSTPEGESVRGEPLYHLVRGKTVSPWIKKMAGALSAREDKVSIPPGASKKMVIALPGDVEFTEIHSIRATIGKKEIELEKQTLTRKEVEDFLFL